MAKSYVKFEMPKDLVAKVLEAITVANDSGRVRKGANETTKGIESGGAQLVVIAEDVEPEEVVMHLPIICAEKGIPYAYIPTKKELGGAVGLPVPSAAICIEKSGNAAEMVRTLGEKLRPLGGVGAARAESKPRERQEKPKEGEKKEAKKPAKA